MKIILPDISLFGLPSRKKCELVAAAGFDGIEVFLLSRDIPAKIDKLRREVHRAGLLMTLHQGWTKKEAHDELGSRVLGWLGMLPPHGYTLREHVPAGEEPVVIFADRIPERNQDRYWVQTTAVSDGGHLHALPFGEFWSAVVAQGLPVVFDTQHVLEYALGTIGAHNLPRDPVRIGSLLLELWEKLGPYTREIHLQDCDPSGGARSCSALFLGDGVLPFREFCQELKRSGWDGVVSVEVSPDHLFPYRSRRLAELRDRAAKLLGV